MVKTDPIVVPIEVDTVMGKKVQQNIKELKMLNEENKKAKKTKDNASKQAVPTLEDQGERRGGIFGGNTGVKVKPKDRKSKQAANPINQFKKLEKRADKMDKSLQQMDVVLGNISQVLSGGNLKRLGLRFIPALSAALLAIGIVTQVAKELFKDGGIFDRRLKIFFSKQFFKLTKRSDAKKLSEGYGTLRVTSTQSLRGPTTQIFNPQQEAKKGTPILSDDLEDLSKAIY